MSKEYNKIQVKNNMNVSGDSEEASNIETDDRPKLKSVVGASPKKVKKSLFSRLISGLVGPEGASGIGSYVTEEIIKPAFKNIIVDAVNSGIHMLMYGERGAPNRYRQNYVDNRPRTNYSNAYQSGRPADSQTQRTVASNGVRSNIVTKTSRYGVEDYIIESRHDAAHVLTSLTEFAERYKTVSVAEYYDLINVATTYVDNSYGWRYESIVGARIVPVPGGYSIKFPPVDVLQ